MSDPIPSPASMPKRPPADMPGVIRPRKQISRWIKQLADKIDADGGAVLPDGSTHPDLDLICALLDTGSNMERTAFERRLMREVMNFLEQSQGGEDD